MENGQPSRALSQAPRHGLLPFGRSLDIDIAESHVHRQDIAHGALPRHGLHDLSPLGEIRLDPLPDPSPPLPRRLFLHQHERRTLVLPWVAREGSIRDGVYGIVRVQPGLEAVQRGGGAVHEDLVFARGHGRWLAGRRTVQGDEAGPP